MTWSSQQNVLQIWLNKSREKMYSCTPWSLDSPKKGNEQECFDWWSECDQTTANRIRYSFVNFGDFVHGWWMTVLTEEVFANETSHYMGISKAYEYHNDYRYHHLWQCIEPCTILWLRNQIKRELQSRILWCWPWKYKVHLFVNVLIEIGCEVFFCFTNHDSAYVVFLLVPIYWTMHDFMIE